MTEKKESPQLDQPGERVEGALPTSGEGALPTGGEGVLPTGVVKAICISDIRGIEKRAIEEGHFLVDFGIEGDAQGGNWHRQVSLLSYDKVKAFNERGADVGDGAFGRTWWWKAWTSVPCRWARSCTREPWSL